MAKLETTTLDLRIRVEGPITMRGPRRLLGGLLAAGAMALLRGRLVMEAIGRDGEVRYRTGPAEPIEPAGPSGEPPAFCRATAGESCRSTITGMTCQACAAEHIEHDLHAWESEGGAIIPGEDAMRRRVELGHKGQLPCDRCHRDNLYLEPLGDLIVCGSCRGELVHGPILRRRRK